MAPKITMLFRGTNAEFKRWLANWNDSPELDACVARHPAGKGLGRGR